MFAGEYGWTKDYILENIYPFEVRYFREKIDQRTIDEMTLQARTAADPAAVYREMVELSGIPLIDTNATIDKAHVERFKNRLKSASKRIQVK